ncbi:MAG: hypothetical protein WCG47_12425, partial [Dermatophilaceae bacterium]
MRGQLLTQRPFEYGLGDLAEQPIRAEQFHTLRLGRREQLVGHRRMNQRFPVGSIRSPWHYFSVRHSVIPSEPFLRFRIGPPHLHRRSDTPSSNNRAKYHDPFGNALFLARATESMPAGVCCRDLWEDWSPGMVWS